jgi:hypothetical protein
MNHSGGQCLWYQGGAYIARRCGDPKIVVCPGPTNNEVYMEQDMALMTAEPMRYTALALCLLKPLRRTEQRQLQYGAP